MKKTIALSLIALTTLGISCSKKMTSVVSDISKTPFDYNYTKSKCETCAHFTVKIDTDRNVEYNGLENTEAIGIKTFQMSKGDYCKLVTEIERSHFYFLENEYVSDTLNSPVNQITYNGKSIRYQDDLKPEPLNKLVVLLQKVAAK